jgi:hypothetical protein
MHSRSDAGFERVGNVEVDIDEGMREGVCCEFQKLLEDRCDPI